MDTVACAICGTVQSTPLYQIPDLLLGDLSETFTLVKCKQCGFIYQNPRLTQEELQRYYPDDYGPYYQETSASWIKKMANRYGLQKRCRAIYSLPDLGEDGRLLDIGCSTGLFLNEMNQSGKWEVQGVDTSAHAVQIARDEYHLEVFHGSLQQANFPPDSFDVVTLWDVLEHLPDLGGTISEIAQITRQPGYLVLRVPNSGCLDAKLFGLAWAGYDQPRHLSVFSKRHLTQILEKHGYEIIRITSNAGNYPAFVISLRFWLTSHSKYNASGRAIIRLLNHPVSRLLSAPLFYIYSMLQFGSEMTVVAKKTRPGRYYTSI